MMRSVKSSGRPLAAPRTLNPLGYVSNNSLVSLPSVESGDGALSDEAVTDLHLSPLVVSLSNGGAKSLESPEPDSRNANPSWDAKRRLPPPSASMPPPNGRDKDAKDKDRDRPTAAGVPLKVIDLARSAAFKGREVPRGGAKHPPSSAPASLGPGHLSLGASGISMAPVRPPPRRTGILGRGNPSTDLRPLGASGTHGSHATRAGEASGKGMRVGLGGSLSAQASADDVSTFRRRGTPNGSDVDRFNSADRRFTSSSLRGEEGLKSPASDIGLDPFDLLSFDPDLDSPTYGAKDSLGARVSLRSLDAQSSTSSLRVVPTLVPRKVLTSPLDEVHLDVWSPPVRDGVQNPPVNAVSLSSRSLRDRPLLSSQHSVSSVTRDGSARQLPTDPLRPASSPPSLDLPARPTSSPPTQGDTGSPKEGPESAASSSLAKNTSIVTTTSVLSPGGIDFSVGRPNSGQSSSFASSIHRPSDTEVSTNYRYLASLSGSFAASPLARGQSSVESPLLRQHDQLSPLKMAITGESVSQDDEPLAASARTDSAPSPIQSPYVSLDGPPLLHSSFVIPTRVQSSGSPTTTTSTRISSSVSTRKPPQGHNMALNILRDSVEMGDGEDDDVLETSGRTTGNFGDRAVNASTEFEQIRKVAPTTKLLCGRFLVSLETTLGHGGSGVVKLGLDKETGLQVAIKALNLADVPTSQLQAVVTSIKREISTLRQVSHPNVVACLGSEKVDGVFYIVTEFAPGLSVASLLKTFGRMDEMLVRRYTREILLGLQALHNLSICHRDVKPSNILTTTSAGGNAAIKLVDFGSSKQIVTQATLNSPTMTGTPSFMAPEVINGQALGALCLAADIWSLGVTVYTMLTGIVPQQNYATSHAMMSAIVNGSFRTDLSAIDSSPMAKSFIRNCLTQDPRSRPPVERLLAHPFVSESPMNP